MAMRAFGSDWLSTQITEAAYYCPDRRSKRAQLQVICAGRETCRPDYLMTRRTFPWLAIELVVRGEGRLRMGPETLPLNVGTVFCYGPGIAYEMTTEADHPMVKYFVDFSGPEARTMLAQVPLRPGQVRHALYPLVLQEILDHLLEEGNWHSKHSGNIALQYLRLFLQKLPECAEYSPHRAASQALEFYLKAKAFLEKNHETLATAEAAAASLGVTPETLCASSSGSPARHRTSICCASRSTAPSICCSARACRRKRWATGSGSAIRFISPACSRGCRAVRRQTSGCCTGAGKNGQSRIVM